MGSAEPRACTQSPWGVRPGSLSRELLSRTLLPAALDWSPGPHHSPGTQWPLAASSPALLEAEIPADIWGFLGFPPSYLTLSICFSPSCKTLARFSVYSQVSFPWPGGAEREVRANPPPISIASQNFQPGAEPFPCLDAASEFTVRLCQRTWCVPHYAFIPRSGTSFAVVDHFSGWKTHLPILLYMHVSVPLSSGQWNVGRSIFLMFY